MLNDVIWRKTNPMPNFRGTRFTNAHETLIWAARSETSKYLFNYHAMKALNDDLQMRSDWLIPICSGSERLKRGGAKAHPTQKPEALLYRVLLACTAPGDVVVDPFFGTGTTGAVAKLLGRHWIGIEENANYAEIAEARIADILPLAGGALAVSQGRRGEARVPFGALVEAGIVLPGSTLHALCRQGSTGREALVRADGTVAMGDLAGSIHRIGAAAMGASTCNGWMFWHVEEAAKLVTLDTRREAYRAMLANAA